MIILIAMNGILLHISVVFIWIGIPKPHSLRFQLAAGASCAEKQHELVKVINVFVLFVKI